MHERILRSGRGRHDTRGRVLLLTVLLALVAILAGRTAAVAGSAIFEDNFDVAFAGWITSGSPDWYSNTPKNGTHSIQLRKDEAIERLIPTVGYTDIAVSFALGASSLDRSTEVVRALWYDGSQWGVLHAIAGGGGEDDGQLHTFSVSLPSGAGDNAYFRLRFEIVGNNTNDYGYVDDVLVSGALPVRTLAVDGQGTGSIRVDGVDYDLPWSGDFSPGASVTLEAVPGACWAFAGWAGDLGGSDNPVVLVLDTNKAVTADFSQLEYALTLDAVGTGSVKVDGELVSLPWSGQYACGTNVTLEGVPGAGWAFGSWGGDMSSTDPSVVVTMDAPKTITATFSQESYTLSLAKVGSGSVKVDGTLRALPWSGSFLSGTSVALEAVPASGWEFDSWSGDVNWSGSVLYVTMDDDKDLTANFEERDSFILSLSKTGAGSVTVNGMTVSLPWSGELPRGSDVTLHSVPDEGWMFDRWSGDLAGSQNPSVITMNGDWDIAAKFAEIQYDLSITAIGAGAAKVNGDLHSLPWAGEFTLGTQITLEAVPDSGWHFGGWSGDLSGESNPAVFAMDGDRSVTATFVAPDQFQLTVTKSGSGSVTVDGVERSLPWSGLFANGAQVTLEAVAEGDELFVEWSGDVAESANPITLTMDSDKSVKAEFACTAGPFTDVSCDHWAAEAIAAVHDAGIANGYSDGRYLPGLAVTRAAMAVFLARGLAGGAEGVPAGPEEATFSDVPPDHWAFDEVEYIVSKSIAKGYGDDSYQPAWQITRGQMAAFVARALAQPTGDEGLATFDAPEAPSFSDVPASMWCYVHVEYLADLGIVAGYSDGLYRPTATVTRDQMAVYVARAFDLLD